MMNWQALEVEAEYRQNDFRKKAEIERLLNPMKWSFKGDIGFICRLMDNLGRVLEKTGSGLRSRYGSVAQL